MQLTEMPRIPTGLRLATTAGLALALVSLSPSVVGQDTQTPLCPNAPVSGCEGVAQAPLPEGSLVDDLDRTVRLAAMEAPDRPKSDRATRDRSSFEQTGKASWYGPGFHGRKTASGVRFDQHAMTAAHRTLPLGTQVKVTNLETGRTILVKINDRGPYIDGRIIDLSKRAASELGMEEAGIAPVKVETLGGERPAEVATRRDGGRDVEVADKPEQP